MKLHPQLKVLVELQRIDIYLSQVRKARDDLPLRTEEIEQETERAGASLKKITNKLEELQKTRRAKEGELEQEEYRIKQLKAKSPTVKTNKEYWALLKEIEVAEQANSQREDEILTLMTQIEELEVQVHQKREEWKKKEAELAKRKGELNRHLSKLEAGVPAQEEKRNQIISVAPPDLIKRYSFIRERLGIAVVPVKDSACQGCHMGISPQTMNELKAGKDLITCPSCQRILYIEDAA